MITESSATRSLRDIYTAKRKTCFAAVRSFKYPYTRLAETIMPWYTAVILSVTDFLQVLRLYEMSYVSVRTIDDVADEGDVLYGVTHLTQVVNFLKSQRQPVNDDERLLQYIFDTATILGRDYITLRNAFCHIFTCVLGDAVRRERAKNYNFVLRTETEIESYVQQMEYDGVFRLIFELFGESAVEHKKIWPLVKAGRWHFYLVRDVVEDIAAGLINIPKDSLPGDIAALVNYCRELEKTKDTSMHERLMKIKRLGETFPEIKHWLARQIHVGKKELQRYDVVVMRGLGIKTRLFLWGSRRRTRKFFKQAERYLL